MLQEPERRIEVLREHAKIRKRRVRHYRPDAPIVGGGEQRDRAAERVSEHADAMHAALTERIHRARQIVLLAITERGDVARTRAEIAEIDEQGRESWMKRGRDREQIRLL